MPAPPKGPLLPPKGKGKKKKNRDFGGFKTQDPDEFKAHADEVKALVSGRDFVEVEDGDAEQRPAAFDRLDLQVVRSWCQQRPLEPRRAAAALVPYPRLWTSKRGRYARFATPAGFTLALLRARPSF